MNERRYDLDWIRIIAILLLHLFHSAMPFVSEWGWHIKNPETSDLFLEFNYFLSRWRMPILFFISGIGTVFVLKQFKSMHYIRQRAKRLFIPLIFGMLVIVPPQIYFERIYNGISYSSYFEFWLSIFTSGAYPNGNLSWHHLWFILYLFIYSLLIIPLFWIFKSTFGKKIVEFVENIPLGFGLYSLGLLLYLASFLYFWYPNETHALVDDWAGFTRYFLFFAFGTFIGTHNNLWKIIEEQRLLNLKLAFFCYITITIFRWNDLQPEWGWSFSNLIFLFIKTFNVWFWLLAIFGYGKKYLNRNNNFLKYANEGIYPFYILHQTFIVIITYYVVQVNNESILNKYLFLTSISFVLSIGFYEFLIKPYKIPRFLFGMKPKKVN